MIHSRLALDCSIHTASIAMNRPSFWYWQTENADALYSSIQIEEYSYLTKLGIQFSPFSPVFVGITLSKGTLSSKNVTSDSAKIETPSFSMSNLSYTEQKEYPTQLSVGMTIYPSPNLLVSLDFDYYDTSETGQQNTLNYSVGTEWFLNANHAFRFGYFTNNDNRKPCSTESCYGAKNRYDRIYLGIFLLQQNLLLYLGSCFLNRFRKSRYLW